jgi:NAD(P)-dependent dehydrogenase (short-subunit alcohol dehydrogenase family)
VVRTFLVIGSNSAVGSAVVTRIQKLGERVISIDAHGGDINVDFSTAAGRLEAIEKVMDLHCPSIDAIISTTKTLAKKPIAIATNFYGITQFIEGLYDELKRSSSPRISILNYYEKSEETSAELLDAILHSGEKKALKLAQQLLEVSPDLAYQQYTSSQKALMIWVQDVAHKRHWKRPGILINAVTAGNTVPIAKVAELLVWLASPANQSHSGEVFNANALVELSPAL